MRNLFEMLKNLETEKRLAAKEAVRLIGSGQTVGLGTGSTAAYAVYELGESVKNGLKIRAVPTSEETSKLAESLNISLIDINSVDSIDITIDGADEFNSDLVLIKGGGGALLKEKIVASMTKEEIIIVDSTKRVLVLGKFKLPVEVIPFASNYVLRQIEITGGYGKIRTNNSRPFITDEGNYIIDADFGEITNPINLSNKLNEIEGLVAHGLFINLASRIIMGTETGTEIFSATIK